MNEVLIRLGLRKTNSGACHGEWIEDPAGGEIASINPADGSELGACYVSPPKKITTKCCGTPPGSSSAGGSSLRPSGARSFAKSAKNCGRARDDLGALVTLESGKILAEGKGEVQEMIDIADFACGLSRQLYGLTMHSERPRHRMYEQWHPLGVVGVISAFNFPVAVWSWNALIALVCGDVVVWKPSLKTPLTAIAVQTHLRPRARTPRLEGRSEPGHRPRRNCRRAPHCRPPRAAHQRDGILPHGPPRRTSRGCAPRTNAARTRRQQRRRRHGRRRSGSGRPRGFCFGAVGTAGQRCTSIRRLFLQRGIAAKVTGKLVEMCKQVRVGDPLDGATLMGPLIDRAAVENMTRGLAQAVEQGGRDSYRRLATETRA